jgi:hypothetical protein
MLHPVAMWPQGAVRVTFRRDVLAVTFWWAGQRPGVVSVGASRCREAPFGRLMPDHFGGSPVQAHEIHLECRQQAMQMRRDKSRRFAGLPLRTLRAAPVGPGAPVLWGRGRR